MPQMLLSWRLSHVTTLFSGAEVLLYLQALSTLSRARATHAQHRVGYDATV